MPTADRRAGPVQELSKVRATGGPGRWTREPETTKLEAMLPGVAGSRQKVPLSGIRADGEEVEELYETASELPCMCNISPSQGCQFR